VTPGLPRPRLRSDPDFDAWKRRLLGDLTHSFHVRRSGDEDFPAAAI
jgi:sulfonate transport system ATP-binding protein